MESPCNDCLVSPCCTKTCDEYAVWFYENRKYDSMGETISKRFASMGRYEALSVIKSAEDTIKHLKKL